MTDDKRRSDKYTADLKPFCRTENQSELLQMMIDGMTVSGIAEALDRNQRTVERSLKAILDNAELHGYHPDADERNLLPVPGQTLPVSGVSTYYGYDKDEDGNPIGELYAKAGWAKTKASHMQMMAMMEEIVHGMKADIPRTKPIKQDKIKTTDLREALVNTHILTDFHLGMTAWAEETHDENWNIKRAEDFLYNWMVMALAKAEPAKVGFLMQLGDFLHFDSLLPVTPAHRHILDADTRFRKVVRVAIRALRRVISMMLTKYDHLYVVMTEGNHDESSAAILTEAFAAFLECEPRVTIIQEAAPFGAMQFDNVMLGWNHGHKISFEKLDKVLVSRFPEMFGSTVYRAAHMGHFHHRKVKHEEKDDNLMTIEQHMTMAAMDAHSANLGYGGKRGAEVISYHREYGEAGRSRVTPAMVKNSVGYA